MVEGNPTRQEQEHEGEQYLELLGLGEYSDREIEFNGKTFLARDFLDICGDRARPMLVGLMSLSEENPLYQSARDGLRDVVAQYLGVDLHGDLNNEQ